MLGQEIGMARKGPKTSRVEAAVKFCGAIFAGWWYFGAFLVGTFGDVEVCRYKALGISDLVHMRDIWNDRPTPLLLVSGKCKEDTSDEYLSKNDIRHLSCGNGSRE